MGIPQAWLIGFLAALLLGLGGCMAEIGRPAAVDGAVPARPDPGAGGDDPSGSPGALADSPAGGAAPRQVPAGKGILEVAIRWPGRAAQLIPDSTTLVALDVYSGATLVASGSVARQAGAATATAALEVDAGIVRVDARAQAAAQVVATASATASVAAGARAPVALTLVPGFPPFITALSTTSGVVGTAVQISGSNFHLAWAAAPSVAFSGDSAARVPATITATGANSVTVAVPGAAEPGELLVNVDGMTATASFTVLTVTPTGSATVSVPTSITVDGQSVSLNTPTGVVLAADGTLYFGVYGSCRIIKRSPTGGYSVLAGTGVCETACNPTAAPATDCDGTGTSAKLLKPRHLDLGADGNLFFTDGSGSGGNDCLLRRATPAGAVETLMGGGGCGFSNATNFGGKFQMLTGIAVDTGASTAYLADSGNHRIRSVQGGSTATVTGGSTSGYLDSATPGLVRFNSPRGIAMSSDKAALYVADSGNNCIRKVTISSGATTTLAGGDGTTANPAGRVDGTYLVARFKNPAGVVIGADGHLYVADSGNNAIRRVYLSAGGGHAVGDTESVAGNGSVGCGTGTGTGLALFAFPDQIALGADGRLFVANAGCNVITRLK
ncbi:MAG: hypothetical protein FJZ01_21025 [Candidatus Sericytochromatia bacterium]|nr:hypothetical protein [Candidatus Tanganyikabacteria bacterium]